MHHSEIRSEVRKLIADGTVLPAHPLALDDNRSLDVRHQRALTRYYVDADRKAKREKEEADRKKKLEEERKRREDDERKRKEEAERRRKIEEEEEEVRAPPPPSRRSGYR